MAIKFESRNYSADQDLLESAQECCDLFDQMKSCGAELNELVTVMDNIVFARDTIKSHGAKWYLENCDPVNALGKAIDVAQEALSVKTVEAGLEGVMGEIWDKIKEFFGKIANWVTGLFSGKTSEQAAQNEQAAKEAVNAISNQTDEQRKTTDAALPNKKAPAAAKKTAALMKDIGEKVGGESKETGKTDDKKGAGWLKAISLKKVIDFIKAVIPENKTYAQKIDEVGKKYEAEAAKPNPDAAALDNYFNEMINLQNQYDEFMSKEYAKAGYEVAPDGTMKEIGINSTNDVVSTINNSGDTVANAKAFDGIGGVIVQGVKQLLGWVKGIGPKKEEDNESKKIKALKKLGELRTKMAQMDRKLADLNLEASKYKKELGLAATNVKQPGESEEKK